MLYLNKEFFKPALIILSIAFGLLLTLFLVLMIVVFHFLLLILFFVAAAVYGGLVFFAWKVSKSQKYYLTAGEGFLDVCYPTINYGRGKMRIPYKAIIEFQYFPLNSFQSWKNLVEYSVPPECIYIKYVTPHGQVVTELLGYVKYEDIKSMADQLKLEVVIMK